MLVPREGGTPRAQIGVAGLLLFLGSVGCHSSEPFVEPDAAAPEATHCESMGMYCEVTEDFGLGAHLSYGRGAATADINGDGWLDMFIVDTDHPMRDPSAWGRSRMWLNQGGEGFVTLDVGIADAHDGGAWLGSFADYDNDGDPDLLITAGGYTTESTLALYENRLEAESRFVDVSYRLGIPADARQGRRFWGASWADYDNDGWLDVIVTAVTGGPRLFHNLQDGTFEEVGSSVGVTEPDGADAKNPTWIDFDHDGDLDLYIGGLDKDALYRNDDGSFVQIPGPLDDHPEGPYVFATLVADFDQDGLDDLYVGRWACQDYIFFGREDGGFVKLGASIGFDTVNACPFAYGSWTDPYENTMGLTVMDFFDDGYPDIYVGTGDPQFAAADILYCNLGGGRFERCSEMIVSPDDPHRMTRGHGATQGDFDRDGDGDLFFNLGGHPPTDLSSGLDTRETNRFFLYDSGSSPSTVVLTLEGTRSNRDAVGARVIAKGARTSYFRRHSSQGFQSQNSPEIIVPTGGVEVVDVEVIWPSGQTSHHQVNAGERARIVEPE